MKKKEKIQLRALTPTDLVKKIVQIQDQMEKALATRFSQKQKNVREIKTLRRQLALVKTMLREKELTVS